VKKDIANYFGVLPKRSDMKNIFRYAFL